MKGSRGSGSSSYASIDLPGGETTLIPSGGTVVHAVIAGPEGTSFVLYRLSHFMTKFEMVDAAGNIVDTLSDYRIERPTVAIDPERRSIFVGNRGISPATLYRFSFSLDPASFAEEEEQLQSGSNGQQVAASSTGRVAFACGSGNSPSTNYTILNNDGDNLAQSAGEWKVGAYPRSAAFDSDGSSFASTDGRSAMLFDASTHVLIDEETLLPDLAVCSFDSVVAGGITADDAWAWYLLSCGFDDESSILRFVEMP